MQLFHQLRHGGSVGREATAHVVVDPNIAFESREVPLQAFFHSGGIKVDGEHIGAGINLGIEGFHGQMKQNFVAGRAADFGLSGEVLDVGQESKRQDPVWKSGETLGAGHIVAGIIDHDRDHGAVDDWRLGGVSLPCVVV